MIKMLLKILIFSSLLPFMALAEPVAESDVQIAQLDMLNRISEATIQYAEKISLDDSYITYCKSELYLKTYQHPPNGYVHFGINYGEITDSERLNLVINSREAYEKSFIILCLANAKNILNEAEDP
jgi:hypothetical protein